MADYTPYAPGISAARSVWDQGIVPLAEKARRYLQGAAEIFPTVSEYASEATPGSFVEDVRGVGGAMMEGIKEDPGRFMAELYPPVGASSAAFESNRLMDMAAAAEKAGDLDRASTLRQLATFSGATAIPFLSPLRRLALTRKGMDPENIYYHGTASDIQREMIPSESGDLGPGVSLAAEPSLAEKRAIYQATGPSRGSGSGPNIMPMVVKKDLKLYETNRKPAQIDIDQLKADGYDGVTLIQNGELKELNVFEASNVEAAYKDLLNLPEGDPMLENLRQTMLRNAARRERGGIETIKESIPEGRRIDPYEPELDVRERQRRIEESTSSVENDPTSIKLRGFSDPDDARVSPEGVRLSGFGRGQTAIKTFDDLGEKFRTNPMNNKELISDGAAIEVSVIGDRLHIHSIRSFEKGTGEGSKLLDEVIRLADKNNTVLEGTPVPFGNKGLSTSQLTDWYARRGFVQGKNDLMIRQPVIHKEYGGIVTL